MYLLRQKLDVHKIKTNRRVIRKDAAGDGLGELFSARSAIKRPSQ